MRTAITLGAKHDGTEVLISGRKVDIYKQRDFFRLAKQKPTNAEYAEISYQESDGEARFARFITDEALKKAQADTAKRQEELNKQTAQAQASQKKAWLDILTVRKQRRIDALKHHAEQAKKRLKAAGALSRETAAQIDAELADRLAKIDPPKPQTEKPSTPGDKTNKPAGK